MARMYVDPGERRKFTVDDVDRMVDVGIIDPEEHVELLDGELFVVGKQGPRHRTLSVLAHEVLVAAYAGRGHVQDHSNLRLDDFNLPEPDVAVIRGEPRAYMDRLPTGADVLVVVEVTVTSHARDRRKIGIYASAGIPEYWLLDVPARTLTVHRIPAGQTYQATETLDDTQSITAPSTDIAIPVRELLP